MITASDMYKPGTRISLMAVVHGYLKNQKLSTNNFKPAWKMCINIQSIDLWNTTRNDNISVLTEERFVHLAYLKVHMHEIFIVRF
jgi:hypothetical protein